MQKELVGITTSSFLDNIKRWNKLSHYS